MQRPSAALFAELMPSYGVEANDYVARASPELLDPSGHKNARTLERTMADRAATTIHDIDRAIATHVQSAPSGTSDILNDLRATRMLLAAAQKALISMIEATATQSQPLAPQSASGHSGRRTRQLRLKWLEDMNRDGALEVAAQLFGASYPSVLTESRGVRGKGHDESEVALRSLKALDTILRDNSGLSLSQQQALLGDSWRSYGQPGPSWSIERLRDLLEATDLVYEATLIKAR